MERGDECDENARIRSSAKINNGEKNNDFQKGSGVVEFCGKTEFADGVWIGINLDGPNGKNDGSVRGVRYFECEPNHGIFMKASQVRIEGRGKSGMRIPTTIRKDMKSKNSPYSSPRITPSSSTEKLKNVGKTQLTKIYSKEDIVSKFNPKSSKTVEEFQSAETTQKFGVSVTKYPSGKKLDIEVNDLNDSENLPVSENVKSIVKKMEESPLLAPVVLPSGMDECNELQWLRIQHKDLTEKIESLRFRRKEDHIKLIEFERNRIQLDTLLQFKAKILEEHTNLQRKLQEKEKELREALRSKGNENDDLKEIEERLELITIEKEMAEEKADILQAEVEAEKQRAETLEIELKLLQTEMEQAGDNLLTGNSVQMKQLEQQNEKLREALIRMRDVTGQMVVDKQEISQENEKLKNELASLTKLCEKINKDATVYENTITELRERVDLAMGSEKMIETLTDKNLEMEEKIRTLEETIADFEAIRVMDEEILETQKDAEKELREELDQAFGKINELLFQIKTCNAQAEDYEKMILMFRKKVSDLNEEIQERYDEHLRVLERLKFLEEGNTTSEMPSAGFVAARTFSEIVDAEIKSLEFRFALQHIEYLKAFMPENFTKPGGDDDVIILNVLFPRLYEKAVVLAKLINDKYPPVPGGLRREHVTKTHKAEQWALCAKFNYLLNSFESVVRKFGRSNSHARVLKLDSEDFRTIAKNVLMSFLLLHNPYPAGKYERALEFIGSSLKSCGSSSQLCSDSLTFTDVEPVKLTHKISKFNQFYSDCFSAIQSCSVERLSRLAQLQLEIQIQERMIDQYIDLLKTSCLDENTPSANLEKGVLYFQNIFSVHMSGETYDVKQSFSDIITQFLSGMSWMKINTQRFLYFLLVSFTLTEKNLFSEE
ncbi:unnamed protein product [Thelazia callipaeda]|uniref:Dynactin subunit 1 n=1 Tax=Thelazia callipaeda TaxID=103827 RepID=A0A158RBA8_THECL|nr:unnamed protein product [Thelazia callipaeda]